jgi:nucleoside-diphosphate-sugar epimerase
MTLLVTGATGFVMSVLVRHWLLADPAARVVALDAAPPDAAARRYFAPVADRLTLVQGDVRRPEAWAAALDAHAITHVVHGATVTPIARGTVAEARREPEAENPAGIIEVNLMGTLALLDWARTRPDIARFIYVSSGSVYLPHGPARPGEPLPEDGHTGPRRLYGISKLASELVTERYGELFGLSVASVRLASVYGTMDRATATRDFRHIPNRIAHMAVASATRIGLNSVDGVGDYIHSEDVASAIITLLRAGSLRYQVYNIASGVTTTTAELIAWAAERAPGLRAEIVPPERADIVQDATLRGGMWGAYDIARIRAETGWRPRPVREAFLAYMDWLAAQREPPAASGDTATGS